MKKLAKNKDMSVEKKNNRKVLQCGMNVDLFKTYYISKDQKRELK